MLARRVELNLSIGGVDITNDIAPYIISFTYNDNRSGEADSITVELEDTQAKFIGDWFPKRNSVMEASIRVKDWKSSGDTNVLKCGIFEIDEIEASQGTVSIKGVSSPVTYAGRRESVTKTWEKMQLKNIAQDIADKSGLLLNYTAAENPEFGRIDQTQESNLQFLTRLTHRSGLAIKIVDGKISIYNEIDAEKESASLTISRTDKTVRGWSFKTQSVNTYKSCEVSYFDPNTKALIEADAAEPDDMPSGQALKINTRVENKAEAEALAKSKLREANKREVTGSLDLIGDVRLLDGIVIQVEGFGTFDGKYRVVTSAHSVSSSGYTTHVELESGPPSVRKGGKGERKAKKKGKSEPEWKAIVERNRANG